MVHRVQSGCDLNDANGQAGNCGSAVVGKADTAARPARRPGLHAIFRIAVLGSAVVPATAIAQATPATAIADLPVRIQPAAPPPGIIDPGYPDFRQLIDVNNDKLPDYCRFVGDRPHIFLSCQLGTANGGFSTDPYGFSAPADMDLGTGPRLIFNIGAGVGPAFCRYVAIPPKIIQPKGLSVAAATAPQPADSPILSVGVGPKRFAPADIPAENNQQRLACIEAGASGFAGDEAIGVTSKRKDGKQVSLVEGADGATIEVVYGGKDGKWIASVQDKSGRHWHLTGQASFDPTHRIYVSDLALKTDEDSTGKPFAAAFLKAHPQSNVALSQDIQIAGAGFFSYSIEGRNAFDPHATPPYKSAGFTLLRAGIIPGSSVMVWNGCQPASTIALGVPYLGTMNADGSVNWKGAAPPSTGACVPQSIAQLDYYKQVFHLFKAHAQEFTKTGDPSIDGKDYLALNAQQLQTIIDKLNARIAQAKAGLGENQQALTAEGEAAVGLLNAWKTAVTGIAGAGGTYGTGLAAIGGTVGGPAGAVPGLGIAFGSAAFGFLGNLVVEGAIIYVKYNDAKFCEQMKELGAIVIGCDEKPIVKSD